MDPPNSAGCSWTGGPAGDEIVEDYVNILAATNVTGYPYVEVSTTTTPGDELLHDNTGADLDRRLDPQRGRTRRIPST